MTDWWKVASDDHLTSFFRFANFVASEGVLERSHSGAAADCVGSGPVDDRGFFYTGYLSGECQLVRQTVLDLVLWMITDAATLIVVRRMLVGAADCDGSGPVDDHGFFYTVYLSDECLLVRQSVLDVTLWKLMYASTLIARPMDVSCCGGLVGIGPMDDHRCFSLQSPLSSENICRFSMYKRGAAD